MKARKFILTALASLAIAAPAAQANVLGADGESTSASSAYTAAALKAMGQRYQAMADYYNQQSAGSINFQAQANAANERTVVPGDDSSAARPDDRGGVRGIGEPESPVTVVAQHPSNFDWGEFGLGGAAAAVLLLALIGIRKLSKPTPRHSLRTS